MTKGNTMTSSLYEQDFYAWANQQAALLRSGQLSAVDVSIHASAHFSASATAAPGHE